MLILIYIHQLTAHTATDDYITFPTTPLLLPAYHGRTRGDIILASHLGGIVLRVAQRGACDDGTHQSRHQRDVGHSPC